MIFRANRCSPWEKWLHGCLFPERFLNSVLGTSTMPWGLQWVGTYVALRVLSPRPSSDTLAELVLCCDNSLR